VNRAGVHEVVWYPDGDRPDMLLVVCTEHADPRWWSLADVLVTASCPTVADADDLAEMTMRQQTGCDLVVVGVRSGGQLVRSRDTGRATFGPSAVRLGEACQLCGHGLGFRVTADGVDLQGLAEELLRLTRSAGPDRDVAEGDQGLRPIVP
jgi:hypothetical protein